MEAMRQSKEIQAVILPMEVVCSEELVVAMILDIQS